MSEDYARETAEQLRKHPIEGYEHKAVISKMAHAFAETVTLKEVKELLANGKLPPATVLDDDMDIDGEYLYKE